MIFRPFYVNKIMTFVDTPFVKILTGVNESGKFSILKMIREKLINERNVSPKNIISRRYDSKKYDGLTAKDMYIELKNHLSKKGKTYLFLGEVQKILGWERVVNSLATDFNVDIYVTGSNYHIWASEISTYLTGRYISFQVYPLSFSEYLTFKEQYDKVLDSKKELLNYIRLGGFPKAHSQINSQDKIYRMVKNVYDSFFSDIVMRNQIRRVDPLKIVIKDIFSNIGKTKTILLRSIPDNCRMITYHPDYQKEMFEMCLDELKKSYLVYCCPVLDLQEKEPLKKQEKYYLIDNALRYSLLGYNSDSISTSVENVIYLELKRRGYEVFVGKSEYKEIGFVGTKQNEKIYVKFTKKINFKKTMKKEYDKLLEIKDNYPKYVVYLDNIDMGNYEGIKTMHVADFLLSDEY